MLLQRACARTPRVVVGVLVWPRRGFFTGKRLRDKKTYTRALPVLVVTKHGELAKSAMSKLDVVDEFGVYARDLRTIDDQKRMISEVLVRPEALLLKLEHVRCVVNRARCVIFEGDLPVVEMFAAKMAVEVKATREREMAEPGLADVEGALELNVLECTLAAVSESFEQRFVLLDTIVRQLLRSLAAASYDELTQRLPPVRRAISGLHTSLSEYRDAIAHVVSDPKALTGLYLPGHTRKLDPAVVATHSEVALSDYIKRAEELINELEDLTESIKAVESTSLQALSSTRNNLMRLNLQISLTALAVSVASCGFGAFGMNLISGLETHATAFSYALGAGAVCAGAVWAVGIGRYWDLKRRFDLARANMGPTVELFSVIGTPAFAHTLFNAVDDHLDRPRVRLLLEASLGRVLTDDELTRMCKLANADGDGILSVKELLKFLNELEGAEHPGIVQNGKAHKRITSSKH